MKKRVCLSLAMCFWALITIAQITIKGKVLGDDNKPLEDASVSVKNGKAGTKTNEKGEFTLKVEKVPVNLVISHVNYSEKSITHSGTGVLDVTLVSRSANPDDGVVIVGYQEVKIKDVPAPRSSVGEKDLKDVPVNSVAEAIGGRLAGITTTSAEGEPGAPVKINVRGPKSITQDNSPLYIIDGVQVESGLDGLVLQDIASIDVLKDAAAAAIYGARGANGVIIITTKSGKKGKVQLRYTGFVGVKNITKTLDVLDPYEYVLFQYERTRKSDTDSSSFAKRFGTYWDTLEVYKDVPFVDWQDEVLGRNAITNTHSLSASGGSKKLTYNASYTYNNEQGIALLSNFKRHLGNLKMEYKATKDLKFGFSGRLASQTIDGAGTSNENGAAYNRMRQIIKYKPFLTGGEKVDEVDPDLFDETNGNGLNLINPIALLNSEIRQRQRLISNASIYGQINLTKTISFKSTVGVDYQRDRDWFYKDSITSDSRINGSRKPLVDIDSTSKTVFTNSNVLTWKVNKFKTHHKWVALVGQEVYNIKLRGERYRYLNLPYAYGFDAAKGDPNQGTQLNAVPSFANSKQVSFFGKVDYTFKNRYLVSGIMRADGSSKFAKENRWGVFKSLSLAWQAKQEKFLQNVNWLSDLKVRASYGEAGNNRIDDYLFMSTLAPAKSYYSINNVLVDGLNSESLANYNLKWETNVSKNVGIDLSIAKRIDISLDYYQNVGKDLLMFAPITSVTGYTTQMKNIGSTENRGFEIQIGATAIQKKNFSWTINFNNSWNKNKVLQLADGPDDVLLARSGWSASGLEDYYVKAGYAIGSMYGFVTDGYYKPSEFTQSTNSSGRVVYTLKPDAVSSTLYTAEPGTLKLKDLNGDGKIDNNDRQVIGNSLPKFTGGLSQQFTLGNFDLNVFVNWSVGGDVMNANKIEFTNMYTPWASAYAVANDNRFTVIDKTTGKYVTDLNELETLNQNATMWKPFPFSAGNNAFILHSWAIEDASFLRINNISLGYTIPSRNLSKLKIKSLRVYGTVNNLAVFTNYSGYDPEVNTRRASGLTPNVDYSGYPRSRGFILGVNANF